MLWVGFRIYLDLRKVVKGRELGDVDGWVDMGIGDVVCG